MIQYDVLKDNIPYDSLFPLMKESFHEREEQGLDFTVIHFELEDLKKSMNGLPVVVAFEEDPQTGNREYLGFQPVVIEGKSATAGILAVSPKCKRTGIGSKIEEISEQLAIDNGCTYMLSNTSEEAISSVKWHLKNRYFKYEIGSSHLTNYYTIFFRKQLKYHWFWSNKVFRSLYYSIFEFMYKLYRRKDSSYTAFGKLVSKLIGVFR